MITVVVDFEIIDKGYGLFKCPSELHHDVNYQAIIQSTITKWLLEEFALTNHREDPGKNGFEDTERLLLSNI